MKDETNECINSRLGRVFRKSAYRISDNKGLLPEDYIHLGDWASRIQNDKQ